MRVISKARLRRFWTSAGRDGAEGPLRAWFANVNNKAVAWHSWAEVKSNYASASSVGSCIVFNIGGNKYRLVTRVLFPSQKVLVLKVMTHPEYDKNTWKEDCGCFKPLKSKSSTNGR